MLKPTSGSAPSPAPSTSISASSVQRGRGQRPAAAPCPPTPRPHTDLRQSPTALRAVTSPGCRRGSARPRRGSAAAPAAAAGSAAGSAGGPSPGAPSPPAPAAAAGPGGRSGPRESGGIRTPPPLPPFHHRWAELTWMCSRARCRRLSVVGRAGPVPSGTCCFSCSRQRRSCARLRPGRRSAQRGTARPRAPLRSPAGTCASPARCAPTCGSARAVSTGTGTGRR